MENTARLLLPLPKELKEKIEKKAKELSISASAYIRMIMSTNV